MAKGLLQILTLSLSAPLTINLGTHLADIYQAQVLMQEGENFANRHLIGMGKILYSHQGILVNSGGNSGDEILGPTGRFSFQVALVIHMYFCRPSLCS